MKRYLPPLLATSLASFGCYDGLNSADGGDAADSGASADDGAPQLPEDTEQIGVSGLRRLTATEYDATLRDILFDETNTSALLLPEDVRNPFDNDYTIQIASQALVEGADLLAADATQRLMADVARRDRVVGCVPTGPSDEACMRQFIETFGRRALRRPLTGQEVDLYLHGEAGTEGAVEFAVEDGDFYTGVDTIVRTMLQDPEFLYRVEIGTPVPEDPDLFKLNSFEVGTRLSYLIWGTTPDDALLDLAEAGELDTPQGARAAAIQMFEDPRALQRVERFHALWLGYEQLPHDAELSAAMRAETAALIDRVIFQEQRPWHDLFRLDETFVSDLLAQHYGLPSPGSTEPMWVGYGDSGRQGLLSHGTFLSIGAKFADTSPVQRGLLIRTRLFCQEIPPPPPNVDVDEKPSAENAICKSEIYAEHRQGGCASCHNLLDPVGFGLENYDPQGRFRTHEADNLETPEDESQCAIDGNGSLAGIGDFNGPAELGQLALEAGLLNECVTTQLYRFTMGRFELDEFDKAFIDALTEKMGDADFRFDDLVLEFVGSEHFGFRRLEQEQ